MWTKDLTFYFFLWLIFRQLIFRAIEVMLSRNCANLKQNYLHNKFCVLFRGIYCAYNFGRILHYRVALRWGRLGGWGAERGNKKGCTIFWYTP